LSATPLNDPRIADSALLIRMRVSIRTKSEMIELARSLNDSLPV
jgi:hypothetical protein